MKIVHCALAALALACAASPASATYTLTESFDEPFAGWEDRWFGQMTNARNLNLYDSSDRGANLTGLSITDGNIEDGRALNFTFNADIAPLITNFAFDLLGYNAQTMTIFDAAGATLITVDMLGVSGPPYDFADSSYTRYSINSATGIGGFTLSPFGSEGNYSIDDVSITAVPEPAAWAMMIAGFGLVGMAMRRRRTGVAAFA